MIQPCTCGQPRERVYGGIVEAEHLTANEYRCPAGHRWTLVETGWDAVKWIRLD